MIDFSALYDDPTETGSKPPTPAPTPDPTPTPEPTPEITPQPEPIIEQPTETEEFDLLSPEMFSDSYTPPKQEPVPEPTPQPVPVQPEPVQPQPTQKKETKPSQPRKTPLLSREELGLTSFGPDTALYFLAKGAGRFALKTGGWVSELAGMATNEQVRSDMKVYDDTVDRWFRSLYGRRKNKLESGIDTVGEYGAAALATALATKATLGTATPGFLTGTTTGILEALPWLRKIVPATKVARDIAITIGEGTIETRIIQGKFDTSDLETEAKFATGATLFLKLLGRAWGKASEPIKKFLQESNKSALELTDKPLSASQIDSLAEATKNKGDYLTKEELIDVLETDIATKADIANGKSIDLLLQAQSKRNNMPPQTRRRYENHITAKGVLSDTLQKVSKGKRAVNKLMKKLGLKEAVNFATKLPDMKVKETRAIVKEFIEDLSKSLPTGDKKGVNARFKQIETDLNALLGVRNKVKDREAAERLTENLLYLTGGDKKFKKDLLAKIESTYNGGSDFVLEDALRLGLSKDKTNLLNISSYLGIDPATINRMRDNQIKRLLELMEESFDAGTKIPDEELVKAVFGDADGLSKAVNAKKQTKAQKEKLAQFAEIKEKTDTAVDFTKKWNDAIAPVQEVQDGSIKTYHGGVATKKVARSANGEIKSVAEIDVSQLNIPADPKRPAGDGVGLAASRIFSAMTTGKADEAPEALIQALSSANRKESRKLLSQILPVEEVDNLFRASKRTAKELTDISQDPHKINKLSTQKLEETMREANIITSESEIDQATRSLSTLLVDLGEESTKSYAQRTVDVLQQLALYSQKSEPAIKYQRALSGVKMRKTSPVYYKLPDDLAGKFKISQGTVVLKEGASLTDTERKAYDIYLGLSSFFSKHTNAIGDFLKKAQKRTEIYSNYFSLITNRPALEIASDPSTYAMLKGREVGYSADNYAGIDPSYYVDKMINNMKNIQLITGLANEGTIASKQLTLTGVTNMKEVAKVAKSREWVGLRSFLEDRFKDTTGDTFRQKLNTVLEVSAEDLSKGQKSKMQRIIADESLEAEDEAKKMLTELNLETYLSEDNVPGEDIKKLAKEVAEQMYPQVSSQTVEMYNKMELINSYFPNILNFSAQDSRALSLFEEFGNVVTKKTSSVGNKIRSQLASTVQTQAQGELLTKIYGEEIGTRITQIMEFSSSRYLRNLNTTAELFQSTETLAEEIYKKHKDAILNVNINGTPVTEIVTKDSALDVLSIPGLTAAMRKQLPSVLDEFNDGVLKLLIDKDITDIANPARDLYNDVFRYSKSGVLGSTKSMINASVSKKIMQPAINQLQMLPVVFRADKPLRTNFTSIVRAFSSDTTESMFRDVGGFLGKEVVKILRKTGDYLSRSALGQNIQWMFTTQWSSQIFSIAKYGIKSTARAKNIMLKAAADSGEQWHNTFANIVHSSNVWRFKRLGGKAFDSSNFNVKPSKLESVANSLENFLDEMSGAAALDNYLHKPNNAELFKRLKANDLTNKDVVELSNIAGNGIGSTQSVYTNPLKSRLGASYIYRTISPFGSHALSMTQNLLTAGSPKKIIATLWAAQVVQAMINRAITGNKDKFTYSNNDDKDLYDSGSYFIPMLIPKISGVLPFGNIVESVFDSTVLMVGDIILKAANVPKHKRLKGKPVGFKEVAGDMIPAFGAMFDLFKHASDVLYLAQRHGSTQKQKEQLAKGVSGLANLTSAVLDIMGIARSTQSITRMITSYLKDVVIGKRKTTKNKKGKIHSVSTEKVRSDLSLESGLAHFFFKRQISKD